jgi:hypothetical protein
LAADVADHRRAPAINFILAAPAQRLPVPNTELFAQLCVDVLALSVLLYYSGGSTNPFVSLYLLPLVIAAATLPGHYTGHGGAYLRLLQRADVLLHPAAA